MSENNNNNIKFRLVKMEKHVMIQFDHIDKCFSKSLSRMRPIINKEMICGNRIWEFKLYNKPGHTNRLTLSRSGNNRFVKIYLNSNKNIIKKIPQYGVGGGWNVNGYRDEKISNNEVTSLKFKTNKERDSFCETFMIVMKELSVIIESKKPKVKKQGYYPRYTIETI
ncbi:MAG: hypothetical protein SLAVMIC_00407 [uncultured marine phage]|uniref:Uncharacterized protein n=1 Tax=uncultured marine phage TaxID=707152 RepID=A0A8D9CC18_9VIRU|nr:MAG: hypothetical protein SLAVMIC_00407 [uncultured marine phage]